jgi:hypothetical protein
VICPGGAEVVRRMAPHEPPRSHDQAQIQAKGCDPPKSSKDQQT